MQVHTNLNKSYKVVEFKHCTSPSLDSDSQAFQNDTIVKLEQVWRKSKSSNTQWSFVTGMPKLLVMGHHFV